MIPCPVPMLLPALNEPDAGDVPEMLRPKNRPSGIQRLAQFPQRAVQDFLAGVFVHAHAE